MYKAIADNKRNTLLIMAVFVGLISAIGWVVGYFYGNTQITYYVIGGATLYALLQYYMADKLAVMMTGARQIEKRDNPRFYRIVENLSITTGAPMPKVYIINDPAPNAFATGRDPRHSIVAATTGLIDMMTDSELEGVMAHEMGHIQNYDIRLMMIVFGLVSAIGLLSDIVFRMFLYGDRDEDSSPVGMIVGIIILILAPIIATIVQLAISRQREYLADATSAMTTRNPEGLASALEKLKENGRPMKHQNTASAHLFINNPLKKGFINRLFSTHPPLEDRIARLRNNANKF
ncbi:MAG: M48 family metalloprotease [Candidatus Saccharimonadaceae bacterium]|nr:M48 family metalloprotease [Candidatus Saccharimonadaceae bacterium]